MEYSWSSKVIFQNIEIYFKIFTECKNNVQILIKTFHILNLPKKFKKHAYRIIIKYSKNIPYVYIYSPKIIMLLEILGPWINFLN